MSAVCIAEKAISYAALILHDDNIEITEDKLNTLVEAAGVEVEPIWASIFAKALKSQSIESLLANVGSAAAAAPVAGGASGAAAGGAEAAAEEAKEEAKEESDEDMGFGLFD